MTLILLIAYGLSGVVSIVAFWSIHIMTEVLTPGDAGGGNGNPALIILVFTMPFLMYFIYGSVELSMRLVEFLKNKTFALILIPVSAFVASLILVTTVMKANDFRQSIVETKENFISTDEISLLNTFSNSLFFNPFTFVMLLLICYVIGSMWAMSRRKQTLRS